MTDEEINERLELMITGDEKVLWTGKTESYARVKRKNIFIAVMLLIMGFLLYEIIKYIVLGITASPAFLIFAIGPVIPLVILLFLFILFIKQSRQGYAITDSRLIIFKDRFDKSVALVQVYDLQIEYGNKGTGTIIVRRVDNPYSKKETDKFDHFFIQGISEPDEAFRILSEVVDLARKSTGGVY